MAKDLEPTDAPFEIPHFDEDEFVRKELISFRTTVVLFLFSLGAAGATYLLWKQTNARFILLVAFALSLGLLLRFVFKAVRIDISHWKRREWLGTMSLYFFFWIGFVLIIVNPPITDNSPPVIELVATPPVQGYGNPIDMAVYVGDNDALRGEPQFCLVKTDTPLDSIPSSGCDPALTWTRVEGKQVWTAHWVPRTNGTHVLLAHAVDRHDQEATSWRFVNVTNPFVVLAPRSGSSFDNPSQAVTIRLAPGLQDKDLLSVRYVIGGREYNMTAPTKEFDYWTTRPTFPGWKTGENNLTFIVVQQPTYLHGHEQPGGVARIAEAKRTYTVTPDFPDLGRSDEPNPRVRPPPNLAGTPGFEAPLVVLALVAALALAVRRSRRHG